MNNFEINKRNPVEKYYRKEIQLCQMKDTGIIHYFQLNIINNKQASS